MKSVIHYVCYCVLRKKKLYIYIYIFDLYFKKYFVFVSIFVLRKKNKTKKKRKRNLTNRSHSLLMIVDIIRLMRKYLNMEVDKTNQNPIL
jgi:hypothetical protein